MERAIAKRGKVKSRNLPACFQNCKNEQNDKNYKTVNVSVKIFTR